MIEDVGYRPVISQRKTNAGKAVGTSVGVAGGAIATASFLGQVEGYASHVETANRILECKAPEFLKNINPKEFINKYAKTEYRKEIAQAGLIGVAFIAAGLAVGTIVDAVINAKKQNMTK